MDLEARDRSSERRTGGGAEGAEGAGGQDGAGSGSWESLEFAAPGLGLGSGSGSGSGLGPEERSAESRRRLREAFEVGGLIEVVQSRGAGQVGGEVVAFRISRVLGMGACGMVVLVEICGSERGCGRGSIRVEIAAPGARQLLEELGPGSPGGDRRLAIKIVDLEANDSAGLEDPLVTARKEISIMSEVQDCEQILRYYVTFSSGSYLYILMEYAEGGSLYGLYNRYGSFPEELVASVMQDVLRALRRLHGDKRTWSKHYILHNDIKSANILLTQSCVAKLADFGVSRKVRQKGGRDADASPSGQEVLGSPFWMAPEVILGSTFSGRPGDPGASDIWSLGITALELAFGRIPWPSFGALDDLLGHILRSPPPQMSVREDVRALFSGEFWDFVDSCLTKDPSLRGTAGDLLAHPFITARAKRPPSLPLFVQGISGVQAPNHTYLRSFFNYMNYIFGPEPRASLRRHAPSSKSLVKKRSTVSISRYFSRKRSSAVQASPGLPRGTPPSVGPPTSRTPRDPESAAGLPPVPDADEEVLSPLQKRVSLAQVHKFLNSPSAELGALTLGDFSPPEEDSARPQKGGLRACAPGLPGRTDSEGCRTTSVPAPSPALVSEQHQRPRSRSRPLDGQATPDGRKTKPKSRGLRLSCCSCRNANLVSGPQR